MFLAFFHKKQHCRLKLDHRMTRKKAGGRRRTEAFTHRGFYAEKFLHKGTFYMQKVFHREVFTLRSLCTQKSRNFYTQKFLHEAKVFTQRVFYTQTRLHTEAFTQRNLYTESFYTRKLVHTQKSLHKRAFTQRSFHAQKEVFTQKSLYTEWFLHTDTFTHKNFYTESLCTEAPLHKVTSWNWQQFVRKNPSQELSGTHLLPKKPSISNKCSKQPKEI